MNPLVYAITGANGQIGAYLLEYLRSRGNTVYEFVRSPEKAKDRRYYKYFDLSEPYKIPSLHGIDVLIHTAYYFDTTNKEYESINVLGTQQLFKQIRKNQLSYSIFISSISAHHAAVSLYGRTKYQIEQLVMKDPHVVTIRPGLIFHRSLKGITATMDNFVKKYPVVPLIGNGKQLIYPCLLDDLARLIYTLSINQPAIKYPIIAATEQVITFKRLVQYLAKQKDKKVLLLPIPFQVIYFALRCMEFIGLPIGLRSDSLLGLQYSNAQVDFSETKMLGMHFSQLDI